jgi:nitric oxide reductase large subunit
MTTATAGHFMKVLPNDITASILCMTPMRFQLSGMIGALSHTIFLGCQVLMMLMGVDVCAIHA